MDTDPANQPSLWHRLSTHPFFALSGWIIGIISFVWLFLPTAKRELTYSVNPIITSIVKAGESSVLRVNYGTREITNDISAVQIAVWNSGKLPIKKDEILEPVILIVSNAHILEVTSRKISRSATALKLNGEKMDEGKIGIGWNILEQGDGISLQVIHTGSSPSFGLVGAIEGQSNLRRLEIKLDQSTPVMTTKLSIMRGLGVLVVTVIFVVAAMGTTGRVPAKKKLNPIARVSLVIIALGTLAVIVLSEPKPGPPFGF